jgi:hypothetical protein
MRQRQIHMTRMARNLGLLASALLLLPATAQAVSVSISGVTHSGTGSASLLEIGDTLTITGRINNDSADAVFGLGVAVDGYDSDNNGLADNGVAFVSGDVAATGLATYYDVPNGSLGGLDNTLATATEVGYFNPFCSLSGCPVVDPLRVRVFQGISTNSSNGDGSLDLGIGGSTVGAGDHHFSVTFQAIAGLALPETRTLTFGGISDQGEVAVGAGGALLPYTNGTVSFTVVPEPGTALLMGLGLAGLAGSSRRR